LILDCEGNYTFLRGSTVNGGTEGFGMDRGSITRWIEGVRDGDPEAVQAIWERYFEKLVRFARKKLQGFPRSVEDEEDLALKAFASFCDASRRGRFPYVRDRNDLWRILLRLTARKAVDLIRYQRRGKAKVLGESGLSALGAAREDGPGLGEVIDDEPTPEFAAMVAEETRHLLERLGDPSLQALAVAKMEGYRDEEIARQLDCSVRTVQRRLLLIRRKWSRELEP
jgi:DNA-directed RNA polymerase specialized sigma24 family protein